MNYTLHYNLLIAKAQQRQLSPDVIFEKHHIIPRCLGGADTEENLVNLLLKEHFIAHLLLAKMYPESGLGRAAYMMSNFKKYRSRQYSFLKEADRARKYLFRHTEESKDKIRNNEERKKKLSASLTGIKRSKESYRKSVETKKRNGSNRHSAETKAKISITSSGERNGMFGKTHTEEAIEKIIEANSVIVKCPHCGKEGKNSIMQRWHFDNCLNHPEPKQRKKYPILTCPHCNKSGGGAQMISNHFEQCKFKSGVD